MKNDHNPLERSSSALDSQQQHRQIVTTICPTGCGNGICPRVFEDSLGMGCKVYCICDICHTGSSSKKLRGNKQIVGEEECEPQLPQQPSSDVSTTPSTRRSSARSRSP
jgi:hypothetical protein